MSTILATTVELALLFLFQCGFLFEWTEILVLRCLQVGLTVNTFYSAEFLILSYSEEFWSTVIIFLDSDFVLISNHVYGLGLRKT